MSSRRFFYCAGLAGLMATATLLAAPHRPNLVPLPADWPHLPHAEFSIFPSGAVYAGDRAGLSISRDSDPGGKKLLVRLDSPAASPLVEADYYRAGETGEWAVKSPWMWNTSGQTGWHTLFIYLAGDPAIAEGTAIPPVQYPVQILPETQRPGLRQKARWQKAESGCCEYFFLSATEAERDIEGLIAKSETVYEKLTIRMGGESPKLTLLFLPRMYGQGGMATWEGVLSYMDRNPTGTDFSIVLEHEMAHLIAFAHYGEGLRAPLFLLEGWAVYLAGGHYQSREPLQNRAAAILRLGKYTPLADLTNSFSSMQHEAAYIEAGAFVEYLAGRFGQERVLEMIFHPIPGDSPAAALDRMIIGQFQQTLAESEEDWLDSLRTLAHDPGTERDVGFTLAMLDSFRRYERLYAPGSNMFDLWLPDTARAQSEQITADYLPSPATIDSIALEEMFIAARQSARELEWARAWELLEAIGRVMDAKQRRVPEPMSAASASEIFRALVKAILRTGDEPLSIDLQGDRAVVEVRDPTSLKKEEQRWHMTRGSWSRGG